MRRRSARRGCTSRPTVLSAIHRREKFSREKVADAGFAIFADSVSPVADAVVDSVAASPAHDSRAGDRRPWRRILSRTRAGAPTALGMSTLAHQPRRSGRPEVGGKVRIGPSARRSRHRPENVRAAARRTRSARSRRPGAAHDKRTAPLQHNEETVKTWARGN